MSPDSSAPQPPSPKDRVEAYQEQLYTVLNSSCELDDKIITDTKHLITNLKAAIIARTAEVAARCKSNGGIEPEWGPYWISRLLLEYNKVIQETSAKFKEDLSSYTVKSYEIGMNLADSGLDFQNPGASNTIPRLSGEQMRLASNFPCDLITGMEEKQLKALSKTLNISMARNESAGKFMAKLSGKISAGPWSDAYYRTEVIARTETARIQELARRQRMVQQSHAFPAVQTLVQFLCEPRGTYPCKKCATYDGNVYDAITRKLILQAPGKSDEDMPDIPIHPNCFCAYCAYIMGVSKSNSEKPREPILPSNFARIKWNQSLNCWSMLMPNDLGMRTITTLPKLAKFEELKAEGNRLITEAGLDPDTVFTQITLPTEMVGPDDDPNAPKKERAVDTVLGKWAQKLKDSKRAKRPSEEP